MVMMNVISKILRVFIAIALFIGVVYLLMLMFTHLFSAIVSILFAVAMFAACG